MRKFTALLLLFFLLGTANPTYLFAASKTEKIQVRGVDNNNYARIIFYCKQPVDFKAYIEGDVVTVKFDRNFSSDLSQVHRKLGKYIYSASFDKEGKTAKFYLDSKNYDLRKFVSEDFIGIDIIKNSTLAKNDAQKNSKTNKDRYSPISVSPTPNIKSTQNQARNNNQPNIITKFEQTAATESDIAAAGSPPEQANTTTQTTTSTDNKTNQETVPASSPQTPLPSAQEQSQTPVIDKNTNTPAQPDSGQKTDNNQPEQNAKQTEENAPATVNTEAQNNTSADSTSDDNTTKKDDYTEFEENLEKKDQNNIVKVPAADTIPESNKIKFEFNKDVAASVFKRGDYLWAVFSNYKKVDIQKILTEKSDFFSEGEQIDDRYYTIIRLKLKSSKNFLAYRDGTNWIIGVSDQKIQSFQPIELASLNSDLHGSTVLVPNEGQIEPLRLIDPWIGDQMLIVPSYNTSSGVNQVIKYVDFMFIETAQGIAIELTSDDIEINMVKKNIEIAGNTNRLSGSAQSALRELQEKERLAKLKADRTSKNTDELALLKFNTWKISDDKKLFHKNLNDLEWKITMADWKDKSNLRLDLARYYLANGLNAEAYGVIKIIKEYDKEFGNSNDVKMVEGAALYYMARYIDSSSAFDSIDFKKFNETDVNEAKFWQALAHMKMEGQFHMDKYLTRNPQEKNNEKKLDTNDQVEVTKLMLETSERLLKIINQVDPDFANNQEIETLESTAKFVASHYQQAIKRFEETDLYRSGDVFEAEENKLWWSASSSGKPLRFDLNFIANRENFLKYYPDDIFNNLALVALEDRILKNDLAAAEEIFEVLKDSKDTFYNNSLQFLKGLYYEKDEENDQAISTWEDLSKKVLDRYNRVRAEFAMTILKLDKKMITLDDAVNELNKMRSMWRGDIIEMNVLKMLGEFYIDKKNYMDGFKVWRLVVSSFPETDESLLIARKMSDQFVNIFNQGEIENMDKLQALTLFYEFRELTPIGKVGDDMVEKLADRLIDVDLLGRAAALLTHQVRFRLTGEEKDRVSTKLAKLHLTNHKPDYALDVINATSHEGMDPKIALERKYLKAQALIEVGKNNQALALLQDDDSNEASFLRADVYWRKKVWKKVVDELESTFRAIRREEVQLNNDQMDQLLRLAVAYAVLERKKRLQILYEDFIPFMGDENKKNIFAFVATDRGPVNFRDIEYTVEFNNIDDFLKKYIETTDTSK